MRNEMLIFLALLVSAVVTSCRNSGELRSGLDPRRFEAEVEGKRVALYVLKNRNGMEVSLCNYGARVVSIVVPDRRGRPTEVTLGFDNLDGYRFVNANFGATIGRYANRIAEAELPLGNRVYPLAANSGPHCLHGGRRGWQTRVFDVGEVTDSTIRFSYLSPDGEEGFPGNVWIWVDYSLTADCALRIDYTAVTDRQTVVNPTNHTFFNLSGDPSQSALDHWLHVDADAFLPVDSLLVPRYSDGFQNPVPALREDGYAGDADCPGTRLRPHLGVEHPRVSGFAGRYALCSRDENRSGGFHRCPRDPDFHGERLQRIVRRPSWNRLPEPAGRLSGDAAFSRFAASSRLALDASRPG